MFPSTMAVIITFKPSAANRYRKGGRKMKFKLLLREGSAIFFNIFYIRGEENAYFNI
jgi:hypothetical protein